MKILIFSLIFAFLFLITGCSNDIERQIIMVEKRVGNENKFEGYKEVTNGSKVVRIKVLLDDTNWENVQVDMDRPPDYKFHFENPDKGIESNTVQHSVWISLKNKNKLEVAIEGQSKYAQLSNVDSENLFEVITGDKLPNFK